MRPLIVCALILFAALSTNAQTAPGLLPFQGRLTDQNGVAVSNGVRLVQFKIYEVPTGGSPVWAGELHRTTVNGGLVNLLLGSKTPLAGVDFNQQLYLEITVDVSGPTGQPDNAITAADPPMLPRQVILPVIFAKESADSRLLDGYDWSALFGTNNPATGALLDSKIRDGSINAAKLQPGTITSNQIAPQTISASLIASGTITSNQIGTAMIDLSNLAQRIAEALNPAGSIIAFGGATNQIPSGWLHCDGRAVNSGRYPRLYTAIVTNWGAGIPGSTNDFNLPDLRGMFLRGFNGSRSDNYRDLDAGTRTNILSGGNVGNNIGSIQDSAFQGHNHRVRLTTLVPGGEFAPTPNAGTFGSDFHIWSGAQERALWGFTAAEIEANATNGTPKVSSETRPQNVYVNYIIKY